MPLIHKRNIRTDAVIGIWEVTETEEELLLLYPANAAELEKLNSYTHAFRRTQFLASRLLLHTLLPGVKIIYDVNGKPFPDDENMHLSLSHSGKLIAMMTDSKHCGIDIETIRPKIEKIASKFLSDEERAACTEEPVAQRMHVYWCVKEAIYKVEGAKNVSLKSDIFVENVYNPVTGTVKATLTHHGRSLSRNVYYEQFSDCMLAWTEQPANESSL
ncbi:MAG: 4'-phosphopantetheinyl transferase superfamily protein [Bacteroidota bacterium]|nr:4'-phosphopantetheinyl transferase superfamily protein [Bacteroidota bacterium]